MSYDVSSDGSRFVLVALGSLATKSAVAAHALDGPRESDAGQH